VAGGVGRFAQAVERAGFAVPFAGLAEDGQCPLVVSSGLGGLAGVGVEDAEAVQRPGFATAIAGLPEQGQRLLEVLRGRLMPGPI
jgi:hypothetical protein